MRFKDIRIGWRDQPRYMTIGQVAAAIFIFVYAPISGEISWWNALWIFLFLVAFGLIQGFPHVLRELDSLLSVVVFLVVAMALQGSHAKMQFYEAAVQVIPVLFLALAVQSRFAIIGKDEPDQRVRLLTVGVLVFGEFVSFSTLASGEAGESDFGYVVGALAAGAIALVISAIGSHDEEPQSEDRDDN